MKRMLEDDDISRLCRPLLLCYVNLKVGIKGVLVPNLESSGFRRIGPSPSNHRLIESRVEQIDDCLHLWSMNSSLGVRPVPGTELGDGLITPRERRAVPR